MPGSYQVTNHKSNDFTWILFPSVKDKRFITEEGIQELPNAPVIEFSVDDVVDPEAESCPTKYKDLRNAYLAEMRTTIPFGPNIDSHPTTAGQTGSHTPYQHPKQRPIWVDREEIGSGEFGTVYRTVNVSTGRIYAAKKLLRREKGLRERWIKEVELLRSISHVGVTRTSEERFTNLFLGPRCKVRRLRHRTETASPNNGVSSPWRPSGIQFNL